MLHLKTNSCSKTIAALSVCVMVGSRKLNVHTVPKPKDIIVGYNQKKTFTIDSDNKYELLCR